MNSLSEFLAILEDQGELRRIASPVDPALEIAEITLRVSRQSDGGPALFFESVRGSKIPVVTNLLGSRGRICKALSVRCLDELSARWDSAAPSAEGPARWLEALKLTSPGASFAPRVVKTGYCQQIVKLGRDVNLWELPVLRSWPNESLPAITLGQVFTRCPQTQRTAVEVLPVQVLDQQRLAPCWHRQHAGYRHWETAAAANQQLPIAIVLGGHPAAVLAGMATLPSQIDPLTFSGFVQSTKLELIKCRSHDLEVPAHAEIVLEGILDPAIPRQRPAAIAVPGGFYAHRENDWPVVQATAVTHRANPIYPAQIIAGPPSEDAWMRLAMSRLLFPWIQLSVPELVDCHSPATGVGRNWLFVSIRKDYPAAARKVLSALWGHPATHLTKGIVVVDEGVDLHSTDQVWFAVGAHADLGSDLVVVDGPVEIDDLSAPVPGIGKKLGIDATRKLPDERHGRPAVSPLLMPDSIRQQVAQRWTEFGFPSLESPAP
ncbi:MAG: UbiD family decarboxylase [Planctomycetaceae bacterium]